MGKKTKEHKKKVANRKIRLENERRAVIKKLQKVYEEQIAQQQKEEDKSSIWIPGESGPTI